MSCGSRLEEFVVPQRTQVAMRFLNNMVGINQAAKMGKPPEGVKPIVLGLGNPGFITPDHIRQAAMQAIADGHTHYERGEVLRPKVAEKLRRDNGIDVHPHTGIVLTPGSHAALDQVMRAYVGPGDEVIMSSPGSYFFADTLVNGGVPVLIPLKRENNFRLRAEDIRKAVTPRTKLICITNPDAPTGAVQDRHELEEILDIARRWGILIISDELYEVINFGINPHVSIASLPGGAERVITINGFSKAWAMTGFRIGYAAGNDELMKPVRAIHNICNIAVNTISQHAACAALDGPQDFLKTSVATYKAKMEDLVRRVNDIPGLWARVPDGTYYCLCGVWEITDDCAAFSRFLWERYGVRAGAGTDFGVYGEGYIRLSVTPTQEEIDEGLERLRRAVEEWKNR